MGEEPSHDERDETDLKVEEVAARYLDLLRADVAPHRDAILAAYPEIADPLRKRLAEIDSLFPAPAPSGAAPSSHGKSDSREAPATPEELDSEGIHLPRPHGDRPGGSTKLAAAPEPPRQIGPYKILEPIGRGGMGAVYLAQQSEPVRRRVALKLIKLGMDTEEVIARFESERQALALMDHPNIARVLDAGSTDQGKPYFVMEHVQGEAINDYSDKQRLGIRERLELFGQVCDGIQHAHHKGIIHRDLKPSNILVTIPSETPVVKIIDFGVAKATNQKLTEETFFTQQGRIIGTPEYMSPEQAESTSLNIDTRTDVYSLGVVLYSLLVGALPFEGSQLREAGLDEIRRKIREDDPPKPSTRLVELGEDSLEIARARRTDTASLTRVLRGELDWITMKALEKDRARRYATASELRADTVRFLHHEPILARPASPLYRISKFIRKHRVPTVAAVVVAASLVSGLAVSTSMYRRAIEATRAEARHRAAAEQARAELQAERDVLQGEAESLWAKGSAAEAEPLFQLILRTQIAALGAEHERTQRSMQTLAGVLRSLGRSQEAADLNRRLLRIRREKLGEDHWLTANTMIQLAAVLGDSGELGEAEVLLRKALQVRRQVLGEEHMMTVRIVDALARVLIHQRKYEEGRELEEQVSKIARWALPEESWQRAVFGANHGAALVGLERYREAEEHLLHAYEVLRREAGLTHRETRYALGKLADLYTAWGKSETAEQYRALLEDPETPTKKK